MNHPKQENLTTQQLAQKVLESIEQMSPEEKAQVRKHLAAILKAIQAVQE